MYLLAIHVTSCGHGARPGIDSCVFGLAVERVGTILEDALNPLIKEQPGTVDELVQHTRWKEIGQFQLEMMD
jgi:hypothetical protein